MTATLDPRTTQPAPEEAPPRPRRRRLARFAARILAALVALALVGLGYQASAERRDLAAHPAPGELVDVGGYRLHVDVAGQQRTGGPTVILESAMGPAYSDAWAWVKDDVARYARVVAYDRPGLGFSDPSPRGTDPLALADDLWTALDRLDVEGPYVVVGHSLGGLHARVLAARHRADVAGLVLVDPSVEDQWDALPSSVEAAQGPYDLFLTGLVAASELGVVRIANPFEAVVQTLPAGVRDRATAVVNRSDHLRAIRDEGRAFDAIAASAAEHAADLGALPVRIVSAGEEPTMPDIVEPRQRLHRELAATLSSDVEWSSVDAGHVEIVAERRPAAAVGDVIEALWREVEAR